MGDDRPFVCSAPGCGQRFTNEDHLAVHKHKHEMTLKFGPARTDSVIIADQTPTPTRFLKNCEEVGLFNELASSFEQEFRKATEDDESKRLKVTPGALGVTLALTPDVKVKKEESVEVDDSSPPDSPRSFSSMSDSEDAEEVPPKPVLNSAPTPTIVRPGSLPLHLGSPSGPYSVLMQLPNGQAMPLPGPPVQMTSVISLARPFSMVPNIPGIPGPPMNSSSGPTSPIGMHVPSEAKMRLKAALSHQVPASLNGALMMGSASSMGPSRQEQSQLLVQQPDASSPVQPQVSPAQPTGGRRRRTAEDDPDERRQRFLERNRAAASRCRQKRKVWVNSLEKKAEELSGMNVQLSVSHREHKINPIANRLPHRAPSLLHQSTDHRGEESPKDMTEPTASPAPVIQHSSMSPHAPNGMSTREAAEALAMSVLAGMGNAPRPAHVIMAPQSQSAGR
ncbi:UNVERIFIED_CONTAM: hypothetical protein FKN15_007197 [Acipenser sinensis]